MKRKAIDDSRALPFGGVAKKKNPFFVNDSCAAGCSHSNRCYETNLGGGKRAEGQGRNSPSLGFRSSPIQPWFPLGSQCAVSVLLR